MGLFRGAGSWPDSASENDTHTRAHPHTDTHKLQPLRLFVPVTHMQCQLNSPQTHSPAPKGQSFHFKASLVSRAAKQMFKKRTFSPPCLWNNKTCQSPPKRESSARGRRGVSAPARHMKQSILLGTNSKLNRQVGQREMGKQRYKGRTDSPEVTPHVILRAEVWSRDFPSVPVPSPVHLTSLQLDCTIQVVSSEIFLANNARLSTGLVPFWQQQIHCVNPLT